MLRAKQYVCKKEECVSETFLESSITDTNSMAEDASSIILY